MGVYDRQIETARRMIKAKGAAVTWRVRRDGLPSDPAMPWKPSASGSIPAEYPVSILLLPENRVGYEWLKLIAGTEVPAGNGFALMHAVDFEPNLKDTVLMADGSEMKLTTLDPLAPNGEVIFYTLRFAS